MLRFLGVKLCRTMGQAQHPWHVSLSVCVGLKHVVVNNARYCGLCCERADWIFPKVLPIGCRCVIIGGVH